MRTDPGWSPRGTEADPNAWRYAPTRHGGWLPPGVPARPKDGVMVMPSNFDPRGRGEPVHLMLSPPGTPAPPGLLSYTPALGRVHPPGDLPPVDLENLSVVPARMAGLAAGGGLPPGGPPPGVGALPGGMGGPAPLPPPNMAPGPQASGMGVPPSPLPQPPPPVPGLPPRAEIPPTPPGQGVGGQSHLGMRAQELLSQLLATPAQPEMPIGGGQDVGSGGDVGVGAAVVPGADPMRVPGVSQNNMPTLSPGEAGVFCGPAAVLFMQARGRPPTQDEARGLRAQAIAAGWDPTPGDRGRGMGGTANFERLARAMGVEIQPISRNHDDIVRAVREDRPVVVSTEGHYWQIGDYNDAAGKFEAVDDVGRNQLMSLEDIRRHRWGGAINGVYAGPPASQTPTDRGDMRLMSAEGQQQDPHQAITQYAAQRLGPEGARVFLGIMSQEGGVGARPGDDPRQVPGVGSYGPLQFHGGTGPREAGQLNHFAQSMNMGLREAGAYAQANPVEAAKWAVDNYLGQQIQSGLSRGLQGPDLVRHALVAQNGNANPAPYIAAYQATPTPSAASAQTTAQTAAPTDFLGWLGGQVRGGIDALMGAITPTAYAAEETAAPSTAPELTNPAPRIVNTPNTPGGPGPTDMVGGRPVGPSTTVSLSPPAMSNDVRNAARGATGAAPISAASPSGAPPPTAAPTTSAEWGTNVSAPQPGGVPPASPAALPPPGTPTPNPSMAGFVTNTPEQRAAVGAPTPLRAQTAEFDRRRGAQPAAPAPPADNRLEAVPMRDGRTFYVPIVNGVPITNEDSPIVQATNPEIFAEWRRARNQPAADDREQLRIQAQATLLQNDQHYQQTFQFQKEQADRELAAKQQQHQDTIAAEAQRQQAIINAQLAGSPAVGYQIPQGQVPYGTVTDPSTGMINVLGPNFQTTAQIQTQSGPVYQMSADGTRVVASQPGRVPQAQRVPGYDVQNGVETYSPANRDQPTVYTGRFQPVPETIDTSSGLPYANRRNEAGIASTRPVTGGVGPRTFQNNYPVWRELNAQGQPEDVRGAPVPTLPSGRIVQNDFGQFVIMDDASGSIRVVGEGRPKYENVNGRLIRTDPSPQGEVAGTLRPTTYGEPGMRTADQVRQGAPSGGWAPPQPGYAGAAPSDPPRPRGMFVREDAKPLNLSALSEAPPDVSSDEASGEPPVMPPVSPPVETGPPIWAPPGEYRRRTAPKDPGEEEDMIGSGQGPGDYSGTFGGPYGYEQPSGYGPTTGYPYAPGGYGGGYSGSPPYSSGSIPGAGVPNYGGQGSGIGSYRQTDMGPVPEGFQAINLSGGAVALVDKRSGEVMQTLGDPNYEQSKEDRAYGRQQASEDRAYGYKSASEERAAARQSASEERTSARQERSDERSQQFAMQRDAMAAENQRKPKWVAPSILEGRRGSMDYFDPNSGTFLPVRQPDPEDIKMDTYNIYVPAGRNVTLDYGGGKQGHLSGGSMPVNSPMQLPGTLSGGGGGGGGGWAPQGMGSMGGFGGGMPSGGGGFGGGAGGMGGGGMGSMGGMGMGGSGMGSMGGYGGMSSMGGRGMGQSGWSPMGMSGGTNSLMQQYLQAQQQTQQQNAMEQAYQAPFGQAQDSLAAMGINPWATPQGYGNTMGPLAAGLGGLNAFTPYGGYGG